MLSCFMPVARPKSGFGRTQNVKFDILELSRGIVFIFWACSRALILFSINSSCCNGVSSFGESREYS